MGKLRIVVLYDRVLVDEGEEQTASAEKAPVTRTLDKKEVEEEVAEALGKLGHEPILHELDGTPKSLLALAKIECDLVFNLTESFADDDTADFKIAGFLELIGKKYTGSGTHGLMLAQDTGTAIKGPGRADFFWGFGPEAGQLAGRMRQTGRMWVLLPKEFPPMSLEAR